MSFIINAAIATNGRGQPPDANDGEDRSKSRFANRDIAWLIAVQCHQRQIVYSLKLGVADHRLVDAWHKPDLRVTVRIRGDLLRQTLDPTRHRGDYHLVNIKLLSDLKHLRRVAEHVHITLGVGPILGQVADNLVSRARRGAESVTRSLAFSVTPTTMTFFVGTRGSRIFAAGTGPLPAAVLERQPVF